MYNCMILGSGRSGSSTVAGSLKSCNYFMGENLLPPASFNPKGFFESTVIIEINQRLLSKVDLGTPYRWLSALPLSTVVPSDPDAEEAIRKRVCQQPFCFKDPRFCYTLPVWRPLLPENTKFICIFREPKFTVASMIKNTTEADYLKDAKVKLDTDKALNIWRCMYAHVLYKHMHEGQWLFVHYDQMFSKAPDKIDRFLEVKCNREFADKSLKKTDTDVPDIRLPPDIELMYYKLCAESRKETP